MAVTEGIRSPFPTQPSARSPKLRIYESLFLLNQGVDEVIATLRAMEKFPFADKESLQSAQAEIEGVRADTTLISSSTWPTANGSTKAVSGSSDAPMRRSGETPTTSISTSSTARKNARSRDCRHVSALCPMPQSPKKKNAGKPSKNGRKSAPGSAGSNGAGERS